MADVLGKNQYKLKKDKMPKEDSQFTVDNSRNPNQHSNLAVVLVSGGMDSATVLGIAASKDHRLALIHFDYGQRSQISENRAFKSLSKHYKAEMTLTVPMDFLKTIGGSALLEDNIPIPDKTPLHGEIPATYVPFRNGIMLSIASAWAEVIGAEYIYAGFVEEDSSGYPDCREEFVNAMEQAVNLGRKPENTVSIIAPLIHMAKTEILRLGIILGVPYHLTWSCYREGEKQCGTCPACRLRRKAFAGAGIPDPVPYENTVK